MKQSINTHFCSKILSVGLLLLAAAASPVFGLGLVNYSQGLISSENDVLNTGVPLAARNFGAGAPAVTVNGLAFGADSSTGLMGFVHGDPGDFSSHFSSGSPLDQLLSELVYQNHGLGSSSITLSGLTPGNDYLLQIFLSNVLNSTAKSSRITIQGQAYNLLDFGGDPNFLRATFNASSTTEVIQFGNGSASESDRMAMNAFAVTAVPEPGAFTLVALGLVGLAHFRRKCSAWCVLRAI